MVIKHRVSLLFQYFVLSDMVIKSLLYSFYMGDG